MLDGCGRKSTQYLLVNLTLIFLGPLVGVNFLSKEVGHDLDALFPRILGQTAPWKTKKGTERFFASLSPSLVNRCFYPAIPL